MLHPCFSAPANEMQRNMLLRERATCRARQSVSIGWISNPKKEKSEMSTTFWKQWKLKNTGKTLKGPLELFNFLLNTRLGKRFSWTRTAGFQLSFSSWWWFL